MNTPRPTENHGAARWASHAEIANAGMLNGPDVILGAVANTQRNDLNFLYHSGDGHILTVAPPGSGKTAGLVIPTLLVYRGSLVVTDPKGTLTAMTARHRQEHLGHRIVVLNPWRAEMTAALGKDLGDTGFNPLSILRDDASLHDNAKLIGNMLIPDRPDERDPYWNQAARSILIGCLVLMVKDPACSVTLPALASMVRDTPEGWHDIAGAMVDHGGLLTDYAAEILTPLKADRQWSGVHGKILAATDLYRAGDPLGEHVARNEFDPGALKREAVTVYIVVPSNRRDANKNWLSLVMALIAEAVGRPGPARNVLLLAEEFANLGYMPTIARAMAEYREAGLKVWLIVQTLKQLARIYGREGMDEISHLCETKQFFSVDDWETARVLSNALGQFTIHVQSESAGRSTAPNTFAPTISQNQSTQETGVPLMRPDDLMNLPRDETIILRQGHLRPIHACLLPYYEIPAFFESCDPNPYRNHAADLQTHRATIEKQKSLRAQRDRAHRRDTLISRTFSIIGISGAVVLLISLIIAQNWGALLFLFIGACAVTTFALLSGASKQN
jgi:type IV secretion system protein VirD4